MRLIVDSYPNNEIRVAVAFERAVDRDFIYGEDEDLAESSGVASGPVPNLDITSEVEKRPLEAMGSTLKPGFGLLPKPTVFTKLGKRTILRCGGALDKAGIPKESMVFLTGTLPGGTDEAMRSLAEWSGYIVHRLKAWVNYRVDSKLDFYCWEWQKRGALHLHYMVVIEDEANRKYVLREFKAEWCRLLAKVGELSGTDLFLREDGYSHRENLDNVQAYAQEVRSSCAAYMAKYVSKSGSKDAPIGYYPVRFWGVSRPLRNLMGSMSKRFEISGLSWAGVREKFREMLDEIRWNSVKHYRYGQGFGTGMFAVGYAESTEWESLTKSLGETLAGTLRGMVENMNNVLKGYAKAFNREYISVMASDNWRGVLQSNLSDRAKVTMAQFQCSASVDPVMLWEALDEVIQVVADYLRSRRMVIRPLAVLIKVACSFRSQLEAHTDVCKVVQMYPGLSSPVGEADKILSSIG